MPDESPRNHGNHVEVNYGTIHQHLGQPVESRRPPQLKQLALLAGGLATALLGGWGVYAQGAGHHPAGQKAFYCASGGHVKYHASRTCSGLSNCSARVASMSMAQVKKQHMEPCQVCH
ncbi:MAG: hypothetical protein ACRYF0_16530 [Janthinobacterium lividum]